MLAPRKPLVVIFNLLLYPGISLANAFIVLGINIHENIQHLDGRKLSWAFPRTSPLPSQPLCRRPLECHGLAGVSRGGGGGLGGA